MKGLSLFILLFLGLIEYRALGVVINVYHAVPLFVSGEFRIWMLTMSQLSIVGCHIALFLLIIYLQKDWELFNVFTVNSIFSDGIGIYTQCLQNVF